MSDRTVDNVKARRLLDYIYRVIAARSIDGVSLATIDKAVARAINEEDLGKTKVKSSTIDYNEFGSVVSWGVNTVVAHMPSRSDIILRGGDLVSADVAIKVGEYHYDSCRSFIVKTDKPIKDFARKNKLLRVSLRARELGIELATPGRSLKEIRTSVNNYVTEEGLYVMPHIGGHGIYTELHHEPLILFGAEPNRFDDVILKEGDRITIEPIVAEKPGELKVLEDGWSLGLDEDNMSAYWEETLEVTSDKPKVLTRTTNYFK